MAYASVFGAICIIRVPDAQAAAFYLMSFEYIMSLAVAVMLVSGVEYLVRSIIALFGLYIQCGAEKNRVLVSYYTRAEKEIDEEAKVRDVVTKSYLEVCEKMKTSLQMMMDTTSALKMKTDAALSESSAGISEARTMIARIVDSEITAATDASSKPKRDASPSSEEGSSICSAAQTE